MTTAVDAINACAAWQGVREIPDGSNRVAGITDWYGLIGSWCAMGISRGFWDAGMPIPASTPKGFAWVSSGFEWMRQHGWYIFHDPSQARAGDLIGFEWGSTAGGLDHIGLTVVNEGYRLRTFEFNVSNMAKYLYRGYGEGLAIFARPPYGVDSPPPPNVPQGDIYTIGSTGPKVEGIQRIVGADVDGQYGPNTKRLVAAWQTKLGLVPDGVWGPQTEAATARFFQWLEAQQHPASDLAAALQFVAAAVRSVLREGAAGPYVTLAQQLVNKNGVPCSADGVFGPRTTYAVRQYQRNVNNFFKTWALDVDGVVGPATWFWLTR